MTKKKQTKQQYNFLDIGLIYIDGFIGIFALTSGFAIVYYGFGSFVETALNFQEITSFTKIFTIILWAVVMDYGMKKTFAMFDFLRRKR